MKRNNVIITVILLISMCLLSGDSVVADELVINSITYYPEEPVPKSTILFNASIGGKNISAVHLIIKECKEGLCFRSENVSMNAIDTNLYQTEVTLMHNDSTYVKYYLDVRSDEIWSDTTEQRFNLSLDSNGDQPNGGNGNGDSNGNQTPGFEIIPFLLVIALAALLFNRKRL